MTSITLEQIDSLDTPFLLVNFKVVELNALEFAKKNPIKFFFVSNRILMGLSKNTRKLINLNFLSKNKPMKSQPKIKKIEKIRERGG